MDHHEGRGHEHRGHRDAARALRGGLAPDEFEALARGRGSAWSISQTWLASPTVVCTGVEEDFLGLAACELWKRLLPQRPSIEMLDDWMQEGYESFRRGLAEHLAKPGEVSCAAALDPGLT